MIFKYFDLRGIVKNHMRFTGISADICRNEHGQHSTGHWIFRIIFFLLLCWHVEKKNLCVKLISVIIICYVCSVQLLRLVTPLCVCIACSCLHFLIKSALLLVCIFYHSWWIKKENEDSMALWNGVSQKQGDIVAVAVIGDAASFRILRSDSKVR